MTSADKTPQPKRICMELRTGDVLIIDGVRIQMEYKKGKTARMAILADPKTVITKNTAVARPVPSLPS